MLYWAQFHSIFAFLDNHQYAIAPQRYQCLLAAGCTRSISAAQSTLSELDSFLTRQKSWCFGHLSYSLKNELHQLAAQKEDRIGFPHFFFFEPQVVVAVQDNQLWIHAPDPDAVYRQIEGVELSEPAARYPALHLRQRLTRDAYLEAIRRLQQHIQRGDCYEVNFCQEFFAADAWIDPLSVFLQLCKLSPAPFAAMYRLSDKYLLCASPERFLYKSGATLLSQPMKGTAGRVPDNAEQDQQARKGLYESAKERAENVMVVDLVRNDLSHICTGASVQVDELFGIYTFPQVHQMISTVRGWLKEGVPFSQILKATFPMGSMTGAPKLSVLNLIDRYEQSERGLFSGSVGYFTPEGDFDFNVVIRSVLYNASEQYVSYQVGSGITFYSDAEKEWEECLLKGEAIKKVLTQQSAL